MSEVPARACNHFIGPTYYCLICSFPRDSHQNTWESTSSTMERREIEPKLRVVEIKRYEGSPLIYNNVISTEESRSFYTVVLKDESTHKIAISNIKEIKEEYENRH